MKLKNTYNFLSYGEKSHYAKLLESEINLFLRKIYKKLKKSVHIKPTFITQDRIILKTLSVTATKAWEFKLNSRDEVANGNIGKIVVATNGIDKRIVRRQRALLIAAEQYTYHVLANHPDPSYFRKAKCQNQYVDMIKTLFGKESSSSFRDKAIRYVIEEIGEHKLAHFSGHGWRTRIGKIKTHDHELAKVIGASEKTFKNILDKQKNIFTPDMLKEEDDLVKHEIEELDNLIEKLKVHNKKGHTKENKKLVGTHIKTLTDFRNSLRQIVDDLEKWHRADIEEHALLKKKLLSKSEVQEMLDAESEAEKIDINKIHILFEHFEKEKINILRDIEVLDKIKVK